ncbi:MAG: hypothetical protein FWE37_06590 [Spirochaetaceae bacterium]|nr:hypothetical protein [Spirochaetaceae bacterium]
MLIFLGCIDISINRGLPVVADASLNSLFPDEALRNIVAQKLGNNAARTGRPLSDALTNIGGELVITNISNAAGLEYLTAITSLDVSSLTNLAVIEFKGTKLAAKDIIGLRRATTLNY